MAYYKYNPQRRFAPKRPIRSFRDLGIYQTTEKIAVEIIKKIIPVIPEDTSIKKELSDCCMKIPHYIAEAHSRRFDDKSKSMRLLEETLFLCNKMVVYLEHVRDIYGDEGADSNPAEGRKLSLNKIAIDEIIKKYFYARQKIFNFYKAWKKFTAEEGNRKI